MSAPLTSGATAYGSHYLSTWDRCERQGFLSFLAPHPSGGRGLKPTFPPGPVRLGGIVHEGLAAYYLSSPVDPTKRDVDYAVSKLEAAAAYRAKEWQTDAEREADVAKGRSLLYDYHHFWAGDPDIVVLVDKDGPVVEREFVTEIPGCPVPFTCRPDLVALWKGKWIYVLEHKTTSVYAVNRIRTAMRVNIQGTGECYTLRKHYPHLPIQGVMPNLLLRDRSSKSKYQPFERDTAARTEAQLMMFERHVRARHKHRLELEARWHTLTDDLGDPWLAAQEVFVANGTSTGACENQFGRPCPLLDVCSSVGQERLYAEGFVASVEAKGEFDAPEDY